MDADIPGVRASSKQQGPSTLRLDPPDWVKACVQLMPARTLCLTEERAVRYAQKPYKRLFFSNMAEVLWLSSLVADHPRAYSVLGKPAWDLIPGQTPQNWNDRGMIPA
jgi:hypothetical protein